MTPETSAALAALAAGAQAIVSVISAGIALWAALIMQRTVVVMRGTEDREKKRATFDLMQAVSQAAKAYAIQVDSGGMPAIMRGWIIGEPVGPRQALVLDFFNALETLIIAIESGAADEKTADRILADLIARPKEIRETISVARAQGLSSRTWDNVERYFDMRGAMGSTLPPMR